MNRNFRKIITTSALVGLAALATVGCKDNKHHEETLKDFLDQRIAVLASENQIIADNSYGKGYVLVNGYDFIGGRGNPELIIVRTNEDNMNLIYEGRDTSAREVYFVEDRGDTLRLNDMGYIISVGHIRNSRGLPRQYVGSN